MNCHVPLQSPSGSQYQSETLNFHDNQHFANLRAEFIRQGTLFELVNSHPRISLAHLEEDLLRGTP